MNKPFTVHPVTNKNSSCPFTHHITTRANQKIQQWSQRRDLCFYISIYSNYIYIYISCRSSSGATFDKQSGQPFVCGSPCSCGCCGCCGCCCVAGGGGAAAGCFRLTCVLRSNKIFHTFMEIELPKKKQIPKHNVMPTHVMN